MKLLRQSTAQTEIIGPFLDKTDGVTLEAGLAGGATIIFKDGGNDAVGPVLGTYEAEGMYPVAFDTSDTDTLGTLRISVEDAATHLPVWEDYTVVPANVYDSIVLGTDDLDVQVAGMDAGVVTAAAIANAAIDNATFAADVHNTAYATNIIALAVRKALDEILLDKLVAVAESDSPVDNSLIAKLAAVGGDWSTFAGADDSLQAIRDRGDAAWTTGSGTGLTALATGTAQSGTGSTIVLASGATFADNELNGNVINIHTGTGAGQSRIITSNTLADDTCNVTPNWATNPDATSQYEIVAGSANLTAISNDAQSVTDLKDFADAGYDPATNKVQGVVLCDTTTTNTDMVGTDSAATAAALATAQADLDTLTGTDGVTLATAQGNYAPATAAALTTHDGKLDTAQADLDILTGTDGVTLATAQGNYAPATAAALTTHDGKIDTLTTTVGAAGAGLTEAGGTGDHLTAVPEVDANVTKIAGGAVPTPAATGVPDVNVTYWQDSASTKSTGNLPDVNVKEISDDEPAADNLESYCDGTDNQPVDVKEINSVTAAATNLALACNQMEAGTVSHDNTAATTTVFYCDDITEADADHYIGRLVYFTSGVLQKQATDITDYALDTGEGKFTVTALTEAPADNVTFVIL